MTGRKTQLEKFEARMGKVKRDEDVLYEAKLKNQNTPEKQAERLVNAAGLSTEDIFMIITRDSVGSFLKMWNNSMENVVRETIISEVKSVTKQVVQEELAAAYRGIMKGMTLFEVEETVKETIDDVITVETESKLKPVREEKKVKEKQKPQQLVFNLEDLNVPNKSKLDAAIIDIKSQGLDPTKVQTFKSIGGTYNTLYQRFTKANPGLKGAWKMYVENLIGENNPPLN